MVLIVLPEGSVLIYDCNITNDNTGRVLLYLYRIIDNKSIDVFINSHRDADHMRGIKKLHAANTIKAIWDTGVPGTTTYSPEYREYMDLRRSLPSKEIEPRKYWTYGDAKLRCMNSKWEDFSEPNEQSVVLKIEYKGSSVMLSGDTNYRPWKEKLLTFYKNGDLGSDILLAAHHGSLSFFDDPSNSQNYYTNHIRKINPAMTLISVGPNNYDLPNKKAVELYEKFSRGSEKGNKVFTTENKGTMKLVMKEAGGWTLYSNQ